MTTTLVTRYNRVAPDWDRKIARLGYPSAYAQLIDAAQLRHRPARVLDAGCGSGAFGRALHHAVAPRQIDLLDNAPAMHQIARQRLLAEGATVGAAYDMLFDPHIDSARYDVVLAAHLLEHLDDPAAALSWFKTVLKPGGVVLLAVSKPHWCTALIRLIWGHRAFQEAEVGQWAHHTGFKIAPVSFASGPPSRTSMGYVLRLAG